MRIGDERIADGCGDCDRAKCRNAGCTAPAEKVAINLGGMLLPEVYCLSCAHLLHPETEQAYRRCECGGLVSLSLGNGMGMAVCRLSEGGGGMMQFTCTRCLANTDNRQGLAVMRLNEVEGHGAVPCRATPLA